MYVSIVRRGVSLVLDGMHATLLGGGAIDYCSAVDSSQVQQQWGEMAECVEAASCGWQWEVTGPVIVHAFIVLHTDEAT